MTDKNSKDKNDPSNGDEDYGLPKVNVSPLSEIKGTQSTKKDPDPSKPGVRKEQPTTVESKKEGNDHTALILILILFILIAGGYALYHYEIIDFNGKGNESDITSQNETSTISPEPLPPSEPIEEPEPHLEPQTEEIKLTEITSRSDSPRYFVVVGSFIDSDLAKDYSDRLNVKEKSTFLIHPYGDGHFYRLSVGHFENFDSAVKEIESLRSSFDENLWVLKY